MAKKVDPDIFLDLSRQGVVIDVRTPAEFSEGHIPGAHNLPLFSNEERAVVGTLYVRTGRDEAVHKGLEFVGPKMAGIAKQARELAGGGREIFLYCWRGGMRSGSVAWLLETVGLKVTLLEGGYKAYRRNFDELLQRHPWRFVMLSGATGSGKTELLHLIAGRGGQVLDMEGLANHKGSAFGALGQESQPTTEHFINLLHEKFRGFAPGKPVWCEGESMLVGHVFIPQLLFGMMRSDLVVEVTMPREDRLDRLMDEYGRFPQEALADAFRRISKRMGYDKATKAEALLAEGNIREAASLALEYYDKAYARSSADTPVSLRFGADNADMPGSAAKLMETVKNTPGYDD